MIWDMTWLWVKPYSVESADKIINSLRVETLLCPHLQHQVEKLTSARCVLRRFGRVRLFVALWTIACQAPLSTGFFQARILNGLPCPPAGNLPNPGTEPTYLMSPTLAGRFFTTSATWEAQKFTPSGFLRVNCLSECVNLHLNHLGPLTKSHRFSE